MSILIGDRVCSDKSFYLNNIESIEGCRLKEQKMWILVLQSLNCIFLSSDKKLNTVFKHRSWGLWVITNGLMGFQIAINLEISKFMKSNYNIRLFPTHNSPSCSVCSVWQHRSCQRLSKSGICKYFGVFDTKLWKGSIWAVLCILAGRIEKLIDNICVKSG